MSEENKFQNYLESNLSYQAFLALAEKMGISEHRLTTIKRNPRIMTADQLKKLASILETDHVNLVHQFGCGLDAITVSEMDELAQENQ